jgi:putative protease
MLSNHLTGRDANRGACTQPCRWGYTLYEEKRPDVPIPIEETNLGTFIMSSKDMCTIGIVPELIDAGINSFKIEGRVKSAYYTAVVTNAYRMAVDAYLADPDGYTFDERLMSELESVSHREYATGFYLDDPRENPQLASSLGYIREKAYIATADEDAKEGELCRFIQRNKLSQNERVELISPGKLGRGFTVTEIYGENEELIGSAPHPQMPFYIRAPFDVKKGDIIRGAN